MHSPDLACYGYLSGFAAPTLACTDTVVDLNIGEAWVVSCICPALLEMLY